MPGLAHSNRDLHVTKDVLFVTCLLIRQEMTNPRLDWKLVELHRPINPVRGRRDYHVLDADSVLCARERFT